MEHRHVWIEMKDGARLAARLFLPERLPAPAILPHEPVLELLRSRGRLAG